MANTTIGALPAISDTIVVEPGGASTAVAVKRGVLYRVACAGAAGGVAWLNHGAAAASKALMALPTGTVDYFVFGMKDSDGTNLDIRCFAAAGIFVSFTPVFGVPTE